MGYYDDKLPPVWYTKIERAITGNWQHILMICLIIAGVYLALTEEDRTSYGEAYDRTER